MNFTLQVPSSLTRFLDCVKPNGRRQLFSAGANALRILVQRYIRSEAPKRHIWANRLGANPTRHLEKGAARITSASSDDHAEVTIPIVGMGRAFHGVTITPTAARALTLPVHAMAYGNRVAQLRRLGWQIFRPKGKDVLMGKQSQSKGAPVTLYILKKRVYQKQDRSLLPSDAQITGAVARAMTTEIQRLSRR